MVPFVAVLQSVTKRQLRAFLLWRYERCVLTGNARKLLRVQTLQSCMHLKRF